MPEKTDVLNTLIADLPVAQRTKDLLTERKIVTVADLAERGEDVEDGYYKDKKRSFYRVRGLGLTSIEELHKALLNLRLVLPYGRGCWISQILPLPDPKTGDALDTPVYALEASLGLRMTLWKHGRTVRDLSECAGLQMRGVGKKGMGECWQALQKVGLELSYGTYWDCGTGSWHISGITPIEKPAEVSPVDAKPQIASESYRHNLEQYSFLNLAPMRYYFRNEMRIVLGLLDESSSALVVGCGHGREVAWLAQAADHVTAIDYNKQMVKSAKKNLAIFPNVEVKDADIMKCDLGQYDLVFAGYNLPGASDIAPETRSELIERMLAHTKPGGHAVISFWLSCSDKWLREYYKIMGATVESIYGNVISTSMGTFTRFTEGEVHHFGHRSGVPFRVLPAGRMFRELVLSPK